jgi:hypothetical protein
MELKLLGIKLLCQALCWASGISFLEQTSTFMVVYGTLLGLAEVGLGAVGDLKTGLKEVGKMWGLVVLLGAGVFE